MPNSPGWSTLGTAEGSVAWKASRNCSILGAAPVVLDPFALEPSEEVYEEWDEVDELY